MVTDKDDKLLAKALDSKCVICGLDIKYYPLWEMCQNGKEMFFAHRKCLFPKQLEEMENTKR